MIEVVLTFSEMRMGAQAGVCRRMNAIYHQREGGNGIRQRDKWSADILGALGEMALAKALNLYWPGAGAFRGFDVGAHEVKTAGFHGGSLLVKDTDPQDRRFYLVTIEDKTCRIHGWIHGSNARRKEWWKEKVAGRPCFFVPQNALISVDEGNIHD